MAIEFQTADSRIEARESVARVAKPNAPFVVLSDSGHDPESRWARNVFGDEPGDLSRLSVDPVQSARASEPENSAPVLKHRVHGTETQAVRVTGFMAVSSE